MFIFHSATREWMLEPVATVLTFVVGPSSFSATQLCRLKAKSWQFTSTRLPNFSSNCFTSGSIPEKSSFYCGHSGGGLRSHGWMEISETFNDHVYPDRLISGLPECLDPVWTASVWSRSGSETLCLWCSEEKTESLLGLKLNWTEFFILSINKSETKIRENIQIKRKRKNKSINLSILDFKY